MMLLQICKGAAHAHCSIARGFYSCRTPSLRPPATARAAATANKKCQAATLLAAFACAHAAPPHIVYVLLDDFGWAEAGFQNASSEVSTPRLDALAAECRCSPLASWHNTGMTTS